MAEMTGGEAVVESLIANGVELIFGLPGIQNDWLYNALYDRRDRIRVVHTRHEQGAGYMALGHALATGQPAVFSVVPGPGFLNASAALATAYAVNAPLLCLSGQIPSEAIGKGLGSLHEIPDQLGIMRSLTKWAERVEDPAEAPAKIDEAFRQLRSGRPRPVGIEVPMDVLARRGEVAIADERPAPTVPRADAATLDAAAEALRGSRRPLIYVSGGALGAAESVRALARKLQAPVVDYRTGRGVIDGRSHLSVPLPAAHALWRDADVALAIGSLMRVPLQQWGIDDGLTVIRIDCDADAHHKIGKTDIALTARAEDAVPGLLERLAEEPERPSRRDELLEVKRDWTEKTAYLEPQLSYLKVIRDELGEDGIIVDEVTQVGYVARFNMPVYHPRTFISTGYQGTLGYGFQTALGVKVAKPHTPVVSIAGDGGFLYGVQELATAVQRKIGLVTLVFNNNQYGNVQQMQKNVYGGRVIATDLHNPDFPALAESFGARGVRARDPEELRTALRDGFATDVPTIVEIPMGDVPNIDQFRALGRARGD